MTKADRWACVLAMVTLLAAGQARADDVADEAELYFKIAAEKFMGRDYRGALEYFLRSNRLVRNRNVMFNIAKSYELLGQLNDAFRYYTLALEGETEASARQAVEAALTALRPRVALVEVETDPPGANLYLGRKDLGSRGVAPRTLAFAPGTYRVLADLPGHEDAAPAEVKLELGKTARVRLTLRRIVGTVSFEGAEGATVSVDGGPETTPSGGALAVPPGRHQLTLRREGYLPDQHLVEVVAGQTVRVQARLQAQTGSLVVATDERDAEILVDGKQVGFTPAVVPVAVGSHTVRLRLPGFREVVRPVTVALGEPTRLEVDLRQTAEVAAVSRAVEAVEDAPSSVSVLSRQDLRAFAFPTIAEALRGLRGFHVSDSRSYSSVGVRGFSRLGDYGQRVLVLLDGHPTNDNYIGSSYIGLDNRVDLEDIERIEVIRGPGSVVYGTNAFLGVINLVPRTGRGRTGGEVGLSLFDYGLARGRARADVALGKDASVWVSAMGAKGRGRGNYAFPELAGPDFDGNARDLDGVTAATGQGNLRWKDLNIQGFYTRREKVVPTGSYDTVPGDSRTRLRDTRGFIEARYEPRVSPSWQLFTRAHANLYNFRGTYGYKPEQGDLGVETFQGRWFGGELRMVYAPSSALRVMFGGEGQRHTHAQLFGRDGLSGVYLDNVNHPFLVAGGYLSADWAPVERVHLSAGARLDYFSTFAGVSLNPRLAAIVHPFAGNTIKLIGARAFRAPSIYEFYYNDDGRTQDPSVGLSPETILSGEIEASQRLSSTVTATASGFASSIDRLIVPLGAGTEEEPIYFKNSPVPVRIVGAEAEVRRDWHDGWMLGVNGSVQKASYQQSADTTPRLREVPDAPRYLASARGAVPLLNRALTLATRVALEGPRYDRFEREGPTAQGQSDLALIWDVIFSGEETRYGVNYALGVYNLFDWRYRVPLSNEFRQRLLVQNGRTLLASLKLSF